MRIPTRIRHRHTLGATPPLLRRGLVALVVAALVILCLLPGDSTGVAPDTAEFIFFDVGQGDASLIRTEEACILIDTGTNLSEDKLVAELERLGVSRIDCLLLSHAHEDHVGGADRILREFDVKTVIARETGETDAAAQYLWEAIRESQAELYTPTGVTTYRLGELWLDVVVPFAEAQAEGNDNSLILRVRYGDVSFLYTGDAEEPTEERLLSAFGATDLLQCDGLKLGHHGSKSSSSEDFLRAVSPQIAVASAGAGNSYGHPHERVLADLSALGCTCYCTNEQGTVRLVTDGRELWAER